jgi:hypothetical protein
MNKRHLQIETLESRELLSVNPLLPESFGNQDSAYVAEPVIQNATAAHNAADVAWLNQYGLSSYENDTSRVTWNSDGRITELHIISKITGTSLDCSALTALTYLSCGDNNLSTLDVSKNTALTYLSCYNNNLSTLDVSKNTALTELWCSSNNLSTLDVSKNTALTYLGCYNNNLSTLDVSKNTALECLLCYSNNLSTLDVSKNTALTTLYCDSNNLSQIIGAVGRTYSIEAGHSSDYDCYVQADSGVTIIRGSSEDDLSSMFVLTIGEEGALFAGQQAEIKLDTQNGISDWEYIKNTLGYDTITIKSILITLTDENGKKYTPFLLEVDNDSFNLNNFNDPNFGVLQRWTPAADFSGTIDLEATLVPSNSSQATPASAAGIAENDVTPVAMNAKRGEVIIKNARFIFKKDITGKFNENDSTITITLPPLSYQIKYKITYWRATWGSDEVHSSYIITVNNNKLKL